MYFEVPNQRQPLDGARLDRSHALYRHILAGYCFPSLYDRGSRNVLGTFANNGMSAASRNGLRGLESTGGSERLVSGKTVDPNDFNIGSFLLIWSADAATTGIRVFGTDTNFECAVTGADALQAEFFFTTGVAAQASGWEGVLNYHVMTYSEPDTDTAIYNNGFLIDAGNATTRSLAAANLMIAARPGDTANACEGVYHAFFWFDKRLDDAEIKSLSINPWQLFEPQQVVVRAKSPAPTGASLLSHTMNQRYRHLLAR